MSLKRDLEQWSRKERLSLHMPGHKGRRNPLDATELPGTDNLHHPAAGLLELEHRLAAAYGAARAYPGTCGATALLMAALLQGGRGEKILLPRASHQSLYKGMISAMQEPVYLPNRLNNLGMAAPIPAEDYLQHPEIRTLVFTGPTYEGFFEDYNSIEPLIQDKLTLLDGAHGAHLRFLGISSNNWMKLIIHSLHKTLGVLNQGAVLLSNLKEDLRETANFYQTTSPSFPILLSMEEALDEVEGLPWPPLLEALEDFQSGIDEIRGFRVLPANDPLKLLLQGPEAVSMKTVGAWLREERGIFFEVEAEGYLLGMLDLADPAPSLLPEALRDASAFFGLEDDFPDLRTIGQIHLPEIREIPGAAFGAERRLVPLKEAIGRTSAVLYSPYPPGTPFLVPGEVVDEEVVRGILGCRSDFTGCGELKDGLIYVLK